MKPLTEKQMQALLLRIEKAAKQGKGVRLSSDETNQLAWYLSNQIAEANDQRIERATRARLKG